MHTIGPIAKTQSQNLRQYKRIAVAAGVDRGKTGNGIAQPRSTPSATGRLRLKGAVPVLAATAALRSASQWASAWMSLSD